MTPKDNLITSAHHLLEQENCQATLIPIGLDQFCAIGSKDQIINLLNHHTDALLLPKS